MEIKVDTIHGNIYSHCVVDDKKKLSLAINEALVNMAYGYGDLIVYGYKDGHHLVISGIKIVSPGHMCTESEIEHMYETSNCPECIGICIEPVKEEVVKEVVKPVSSYKKALVIYHKDDNDGVFSGAIMKKFCEECLSELNAVKATCIGVDYNDLSAYTENILLTYSKEYEYLVLTDISLPVPLMKYCYKLWRKNFIWIDHHAPIIQATNETEEKIGEFIEGIRNVQHSAIYHAWQYYIHFRDLIPYNKINTPDFIDVLSRWDSFTFISNDDKEYCYTVNKAVTNSCKLDIENAEMFITQMENGALSISDYYKFGQDLVAVEDEKIEQIIMNDGDITWKVQNYSACALFMHGATNSRMFKCLKQKGPDIGIVFKHKPNGSWVVSVYDIQERTDNKFHIGNWCRAKYNGGGHEGAGGFTLTQDEFIQVLKTKTL